MNSMNEKEKRYDEKVTRTFRVPGSLENSNASKACGEGNSLVTSLERSGEYVCRNRSASLNLPHRDPTHVISSTTSGPGLRVIAPA